MLKKCSACSNDLWNSLAWTFNILYLIDLVCELYTKVEDSSETWYWSFWDSNHWLADHQLIVTTEHLSDSIVTTEQVIVTTKIWTSAVYASWKFHFLWSAVVVTLHRHSGGCKHGCKKDIDPYNAVRQVGFGPTAFHWLNLHAYLCIFWNNC